MELTKKQFALGLISLFGVIAISLFLLFSSRGGKEDGGGGVLTMENLYETTRPADVEECKRNAKNFRTPIKFNATLGKDLIGLKKRHDNDELMYSSLWLTGDQAGDAKSLYQARAMACENRIPVMVIRARPAGFDLSDPMKNWEYYKPAPLTRSWGAYDKKLAYYVTVLRSVPSIVVVEPDLFMYLNDASKTERTWKNKRYEDFLLARLMTLIT